MRHVTTFLMGLCGIFCAFYAIGRAARGDYMAALNYFLYAVGYVMLFWALTAAEKYERESDKKMREIDNILERSRDQLNRILQSPHVNIDKLPEDDREAFIGILKRNGLWQG